VVKHLSNKVVLGLGACALSLASQAQAVEILNVKQGEKQTKVVIGGYGKVDIRHVSGDVAYQDYWLANFPGGVAQDTSHTAFNVKESRVNLTVQHGDIKGFVEMDFYGGGGNEVVSNSSTPRLRHLYIQYKNWMAGQNWTTFMPLHALPESLDFGGPHAGEVFIRQTQLRYTHGAWQFAIENPETNGDGDVGSSVSGVGVTGAQADKDESLPDFIARYNHKADWGMVSVAGLLRKVDQGGLDKTATAFNIAAKINTVGKDDLRFQVTRGDAGRYVAAGITPDIVTAEGKQTAEVESTVAYAIAYRHFWTPKLRSSVFYGSASTDVLERKRSHFGVNLITSYNEYLDLGVEIGNFSVDDERMQSIDSNYLQFSAKLKF